METKPQPNQPIIDKYELERVAITVGIQVFYYWAFKYPNLIYDEKQ